MKPETRVTAVCLNKGTWLLVLLMVLLFLAVEPPGALAQRSARVIHRNLEELVSTADTIVLGRVLSVRAQPHPQYQGLMTVVVDLEVIDLLKGKTGTHFSYRQYVWDDRDAQTKLGYKVGEEVLLLMIKPHPETGLSSPAGVHQGRFRISFDAQGNRLASNSFDNGALFRGMDPASNSKLQSLNVQARTLISQHRSGPIPYDQLKSVIQALAANSAN